MLHNLKMSSFLFASSVFFLVQAGTIAGGRGATILRGSVRYPNTRICSD